MNSSGEVCGSQEVVFRKFNIFIESNAFINMVQNIFFKIVEKPGVDR
jgi:hypothetical protein